MPRSTSSGLTLVRYDSRRDNPVEMGEVSGAEQRSTLPHLEIAEIRVLILGLKEVFCKHRDKRRPLYIVFGVGGQQFKTETVKSNNPKWTEGENIPIESELVPLRMTLYEENADNHNNHKAWGRVRLDLSTIPDEKDSRYMLAKLQPTPDNAKPKGYVVYECFVTKYREKNQWFLWHWLKQHLPACYDSLINTDPPTTECFSRPFAQRRRRRVIDRMPTLEQKVIQSIIGTANEQESTDNLLMNTTMLFPLMVSKIAQEVKAKEENVKKKRAQLKKAQSWPKLNKREIPKGMAKTASFLWQHDEEPKGETEMDKTKPLRFSNPDMTGSVRRKITYRKAETYEAIARQLKKRKSTQKLSPNITDVVPTSGSVWGGTRLTISGTCLGWDKNDILSLYVCGSSCLATFQQFIQVEYESPERIYCTTKSWRACTGPIVIVTAFGGRSTGQVDFTFVHEPQPQVSINLSPSEDGDSPEKESLQDEMDLVDHAEAVSRYLSAEEAERYEADRRRSMLLLNTVEEQTQTSEELLEQFLTLERDRLLSTRSKNIAHKIREENKSLHLMVHELQNVIAEQKARNLELHEYMATLVAQVMEENPNAKCLEEYLTTKF